MGSPNASTRIAAQGKPTVLAPGDRERAAVAGEFVTAPVGAASRGAFAADRARVVTELPAAAGGAADGENTAEIRTEHWRPRRSDIPRGGSPRDIPPDRRCAPRVALRREVRLRDRGEPGTSLPAELLDLSQGGLFLRTALRLQPGAMIAGAFRADALSLGRPIRFVAQVVWCGGAAARRGAGLRFTELTAEGVQAVARLVASAPLCAATWT